MRIDIDKIYESIQVLSNNDQILHDKTFQLESLLNLYFRYNNEEEKFSKFVKKEVEKFEQSRLQDKKGT